MRGLHPEQFWNMTFFEFRKWSSGAIANEELEWQRTSLLAAILANQNRGKGKRPLTPDDFNPYSDINSGNKDANKDVNDALKIAEQFQKQFSKDGTS